MGVKVLTAPTVEPITVAEAKAHLRVELSEDDALIARCISAAREECEHLLDRSVAEQTLALWLDAFPSGAILLPRGPVQIVDSVTYVDAAGVQQTLAQEAYALDDAQPDAWIVPAFGYAWPATRASANAVQIQFQTGYSVCPASIKSWLLLRVGTLYEWREADTDRPAVPQAFVDRLLDRHRAVGV